MKKICISLLVNGFGLYLISQLFPTIAFEKEALVFLTLIFGLLNITVKPILKLLSLPITLLSLGLFTLVINGLMLYMALNIATPLENIDFGTCIIAGFVFSIINTALNAVFKK